ncbi:unnamed protein product [Rotaria sordida]|uniref:Uncharacterized protein n=1 Tax=Rotaria sordida TaxID=392033 RepID=A0A813WW93_9BILA|nr:unnamed protein product [Rotaria sordida]
MNIYMTIMGCVQPSQSFIPSNHIPIERLYDDGSYPMMIPSPIVMITAPPAPAYVKSALKKSDPDEQRMTERRIFSKRQLPSANKSVNFDETVLVKSRTPTPSKIWYEKASSTMPMRSNRSNDDDDDDDDNDNYDDDEVLSDEGQESNEQMDTESYIPRLGTPTPLIRRNQKNSFWNKTNTVGLMPPTDTTLNNESYPLNTQQYSSQMNINTTENRIASSGNRIKVRRRLPHFGPPQISPDSSYEHPRQPSAIPLQQSSQQFLAVPLRQTSRRPSVVLLRQTPRQPVPIPLHQSSVQPTAVLAYRFPTQTSIVSPYQSPVQPHTVLSYQTPIQPQTTQSYQSPIQPQTILSYQSPVQPSSETVHVK